MTHRLIISLLALAIFVPTMPAQTLVGTDEVVSGRNATTRVWENIYEEPVLDADGEPTGETEERRARYIEMADGLCYDDRTWAEIDEGGASDWQPTVTDWVTTDDPNRPYEVTSGPLHVSLSSDITLPSHVRVQADGETLTLGVAGVALQDRSTGEIFIFDEPSRVTPEVDGNRILFPGVFTCGDVEYVYERGGFKQNLIIRSLDSIPTAESVEFDPETTIIGLVSPLDLTSYPHTLSQVGVEIESLMATGAAVENDLAPLAFTNAAGREVIRLAQGSAWDAGGESAPVRHGVRELATRRQSQDVLIDGVDLDWLTGAELPVTVDYTLEPSGDWQDHPQNMVFVRGVTYYLSSTFVLYNGQTVAIEPGAIIKVEAETYGFDVHAGCQLLAYGEPYDPIIFTNADNDAVGEPINDASETGSPYRAINFWSVANSSDVMNDSALYHCRFSDFTLAVDFKGAHFFDEDNIRHSVFRDCYGAIRQSNASGDPVLEILNCLIARGDSDASVPATGYYGIVTNVPSGSTPTLTVNNLTFSGLRSGIYFDDISGTPSVNLTVHNSLFTNIYYGMRISGSMSVTGVPAQRDHNRYDNVTAYTTNVPITAGNNIDLDGTPYLNADGGYTDTPAGEFYTAVVDTSGSGGTITGPKWNSLNSVSDTTLHADLDDCTIVAPALISGSISADTWDERTIDDDDNGAGADIGYHYPHVDYVISNASHSLTGDLTINAGTVLTYAGSSAKIVADDSGGTARTLSVNGDNTADGLVRCYPVAATGDMVDDVTDTSYAAAFVLDYDCDADSSIEFAYIRGASSGVDVRVDRPINPIENCRFVDCDRAIQRLTNHISGQGNGVSPWRLDVRNNLFLRCDAGIYWAPNTAVEAAGDVFFFRVEGNTFAQGSHGLEFNEDADEGEWTFNLVFEDNLVSQMEVGIEGPYANSGVTYDVNVVDRCNVYWMNKEDVDSGSLFDGEVLPDSSTRNNDQVNAMSVHSTSLSTRRYDVTTNGLFGDDGFFLAQANGERSRFPLVVPDNVELSASSPDGIVVPAGSGIYGVRDELNIYVGVANASTVPAEWDIVNLGSLVNETYSDGSQEGDGLDRLWIALYAEVKDEAISIAADDYFDINFDNGHSLRIYLPALSLGNTNCRWGGWVALDGSVYYANSNHPADDSQATIFNQCSDFAMAYDDTTVSGRTALARSQRTGAAANSPLVDAGSLDFLNDGFTDTDMSTPDNTTTLANVSIGTDVGDLDAGFMDIGFHYRGEMRHPWMMVDQVGVATYVSHIYTLPGPVTAETSEWDAVNAAGEFLTFADPCIDSNREIDIVSGYHSQTLDEDLTVAVFPTELYDAGYGGNAIAIAFVPFRMTNGVNADPVSPAYVAIDTGQYFSTPMYPYTPHEVAETPASREGMATYIQDCRAVAACTTPARGDGDSEGDLYVAAVFRYSDEDAQNPYVTDQIHVWRLDIDTAQFPDNVDDPTPGINAGNEIWFGGYGYPIGSTHPPYITNEERLEILDVTLCADNVSPDGGLYVSWIQRYPDAENNPHGDGAQVLCQYIASAETNGYQFLGRAWNSSAWSGTAIEDDAFVVDGGGITDHFQITFDVEREIVSAGIGIADHLNSIESDFDFEESQPRLIHFDFQDDSVDFDVLGPRSSLLRLNVSTLVPEGVIETGEANLWMADHDKTGGGEVTTYFGAFNASTEYFASLAVNHADTSNGDRAFANYTLEVGPSTGNEDYDLYVQTLQQSSGNDDWATLQDGDTLNRPSSPANSILNYPDVTWRFSGSPRVISAQSVGGIEYVSTNLEIITSADETLGSSLYPHIATNGENLFDNFIVYVTTSGSSQEINITQVDP